MPLPVFGVLDALFIPYAPASDSGSWPCNEAGVLALNVKPGDEVDPGAGRMIPDVEAYALGRPTLDCMDIAGTELGRPRVLC